MRAHELIRPLRETEPAYPETPWDDLRTGQAATFYAWRGTGGATSPLSDRWQAKLGRAYLLGDGIYMAPTKLMARRFGDPQHCRVRVANPYVFPDITGSGLIGVDLDAIRHQHDGAIILRGRGAGNEDIRQACVWPEHRSASVEIGIAAPTLSTLQPGAMVKIIAVPERDRAARGHLLGQVGRVVSMTLGHPSVRIKGKTYWVSRQDVAIV